MVKALFAVAVVAVVIIGAIVVSNLSSPERKRRNYFDEAAAAFPGKCHLDGDRDVGVVFTDIDCTGQRLRSLAASNYGDEMRRLGFRWIQCAGTRRLDL